jgi:membrane protein DedA with SNARE-associated domain
MADQIVQQIVDWISVAPPLGVYLIFFGIAYLENVVPPIPGDVLVAFGGYLVAEGVIRMTPVWTLTVVASVLGFMTMYWVGYKWGAQIEANKGKHIVLRYIDYKYFERGKSWMSRWGQGVVLANRFLAGTRSVISLTAGMSHLNITPTIISSLVSSILWNTLLLAMGWLIRDNWHVIGHYLSNYGKIILALIALFIVLKLTFSKSSGKSAEENSKE